jgi:hypothetical protein
VDYNPRTLLTFGQQGTIVDILTKDEIPSIPNVCSKVSSFRGIFGFDFAVEEGH